MNSDESKNHFSRIECRCLGSGFFVSRQIIHLLLVTVNFYFIRMCVALGVTVFLDVGVWMCVSLFRNDNFTMLIELIWFVI